MSCILESEGGLFVRTRLARILTLALVLLLATPILTPALAAKEMVTIGSQTVPIDTKKLEISFEETPSPKNR